MQSRCFYRRVALIGWFVDPEFWGQGIALGLTKELLKAQPPPELLLKPGVPHFLKLLERCGYQAESPETKGWFARVSLQSAAK